MKGNTITGGIIITILLTSIIFTFTSSIFLESPIKFGEDVSGVIRTYTLVSEDVPGAKHINLNFTVKAGRIYINFTDDSNLIYKFVFKQDKEAKRPNIENITFNNGLLVNVMAESGDIKITLGNNYIYNGTLRVGLGGITARFSNYSNIEFFDLSAIYAGGVLVDIEDGASFDNFNLRVNSGGITIQIKANSLKKSSNISARVELGGVIINSIPVGMNLGSRLRAIADIGGVSINPGNFSIIKQTANEVEIMTNNYLMAPTKLDIEIFTGLGGTLINKNFFLS
ncbi:MAG: hypothetical protein QXL52_00405 [Nitrososphaerales archaeon]